MTVTARFVLTAALCAVTFARCASAAKESFDCVLEPLTTTELDSPEQGMLNEVLVARGDRVAEGQIVARIDSQLEELAAELSRLRAVSEVEIRSAQVQLEFRQRELERLESLRQKGAVTDRDFMQATVEHKLALLALESAKLNRRVASADHKRAKAHIERRAIRSPVDGIVANVNMSPGEFVNETANVMTIAALDPLNVEVFVPVSRFSDLFVGMPAEVVPEPPIDGRYQATVTVIDRVFDPASRTFGVRLELENQDFALPAGLRCTVRFLDSKD